MANRMYRIQENGQVTLPAEWREKHGLKKGDMVTFVETEDGLLVLPRVAAALDALERIGQALKEQGISFDEMMEMLAQTRQELYDEKYAPEMQVDA